MKYAMLPTPWEETLQALDAAGHERAPLEEAGPSSSTVARMISRSRCRLASA